jgi:hypothetical protein
MNRLLNFMLRMPVELLAGGVELLATAAREFQTAFTETANWIVPPSRTVSNDSVLPLRSPSIASEVNYNSYLTPQQEIELMHDDYDFDQKLARKDTVKYVDFSIRFSKPDHQALLYEETGFPVNYSTNTDSFAALRVGEFLANLKTGLEIPSAWKDGRHPKGEYDYDNEAKPKTYKKVPKKDQEHIEFKITKIDDSSEKKEASEVDAIREVRDEITGVRQAIEKIWD